LKARMLIARKRGGGGGGDVNIGDRWEKGGNFA